MSAHPAVLAPLREADGADAEHLHAHIEALAQRLQAKRSRAKLVTLGGVDVPEGATLFLWLAASGRDTSVFPEPETFDLRRADASKTLTFGKGIHDCLGAALGKLEAQLALEALTHRFPRLRLVEGQTLSFFRGKISGKFQENFRIVCWNKV